MEKFDKQIRAMSKEFNHEFQQTRIENHLLSKEMEKMQSSQTNILDSFDQLSRDKDL